MNLVLNGRSWVSTPATGADRVSHELDRMSQNAAAIRSRQMQRAARRIAGAQKASLTAATRDGLISEHTARSLVRELDATLAAPADVNAEAFLHDVMDGDIDGDIDGDTPAEPPEDGRPAPPS